MRHDLWHELWHKWKLQLRHDHDEPRWFDGAGTGSKRGTGSRPCAEHMILTCGKQLAVSLGQPLRELESPESTTRGNGL
jgi:hypothetical protein